MKELKELKAEIERIIDSHLGTSYDFDVGEAAAAIAELWEENEVAIIEEYQTNLDGYQARLAEMAGYLRWYRDHHDAHHAIYQEGAEEYSDERMFEISKKTEQALAAAGKEPQDAE